MKAIESLKISEAIQEQLLSIGQKEEDTVYTIEDKPKHHSPKEAKTKSRKYAAATSK